MVGRNLPGLALRACAVGRISKQVAQSRARRRFAAQASSQLDQPQFDGPDQPTIVLRKFVEGRAALEIQRTDVPAFRDFIVLVLEEYAQRQSLSPTH